LADAVHEVRVARLVVDPVVGGRRQSQPHASHVGLRDRPLAVVHAHVAVDVEEAHELTALLDAQTR